MYEALFIGKNLIELDKIDSTNNYLQELNNEERILEGTVVTAKDQYSGKGQRGNDWISEQGKNLTFSIFFKPKIDIQNQFLISKVISLGLVDYLTNSGLKNVKIKWPNDIYINNNKIAGVLIENLIRGSKIYNSIAGIGLNVNQKLFPSELMNVTSLANEIEENVDLRESLNELLFFIERRYLALKANKIELINKEYLACLYRMNEPSYFLIDNKKVDGIITGVDSTGKLQVEVNNKLLAFDLKEIIFLKDEF